jgi:hypothetical protein
MQTLPKEIVVFLPTNNPHPPLQIGQELVQFLGVGRAEFGIDPLLGGVEVRIFYAEGLLERIREWLQKQEAVFEITFLH